jgi:hypothetical protein
LANDKQKNRFHFQLLLLTGMAKRASFGRSKYSDSCNKHGYFQYQPEGPTHVSRSGGRIRLFGATKPCFGLGLTEKQNGLHKKLIDWRQDHQTNWAIAN